MFARAAFDIFPFSAQSQGVGGGGGGLFFFWSAPTSIAMTIIPKSIIIVLVLLALDILVLLTHCRFFLWFLDVLPTVENARSWKIP